MNKYFKGEGFQNRYRINGTLTTLSPLHIGSGEEKDINFKPDQSTLVSTVIKDHNGKPIIPGSAIKGVMRHWLHSVLAGVGENWAMTHEYSAAEMTDLTQANQLKKVKADFSWLELLFGTPFHEGKLEAWDAICQTKSLTTPDKLLNWDPNSLTYIETSVAIDPATGTAIEHLLYNYEVVPPGLVFDLNLTGQNLSRIELGLLFLALQGFNSEIFAVQLGGKTGRGFGRVRLKLGQIFCLDAENIKPWIAETMNSFNGVDPGKDAAGYFALPVLSDAERQKLVDEVKALFIVQMGR